MPTSLTDSGSLPQRPQPLIYGGGQSYGTAACVDADALRPSNLCMEPFGAVACRPLERSRHDGVEQREQPERDLGPRYVAQVDDERGERAEAKREEATGQSRE